MIAVYVLIQPALLVLSIAKARKFVAFLISSSATTLISALCISVLTTLRLWLWWAQTWSESFEVFWISMNFGQNL